jgi:hypothetical protein
MPIVGNWNRRIWIISRRDDSDFLAVGVTRTPGLVHVDDEFSGDVADDRAEAVQPRPYLIWIYRDSLCFHRTPNNSLSRGHISDYMAQSFDAYHDPVSVLE